jgi:hypothetical protein
LFIIGHYTDHETWGRSFFNNEPHEKAWRGLIARNPRGLYTDDGSDGSPCAKVGFTFSVGGDMERRLSSSITEKSKSSKIFSKMRKSFKISNLRIRFFENLSEKTRSRVIVARKFL